MYNEHDSLTSKHKITLNSFTYCSNQLINIQSKKDINITVSSINKYTPNNFFYKSLFSFNAKIAGFLYFTCNITQSKRILLGIINYQSQ